MAYVPKYLFYKLFFFEIPISHCIIPSNTVLYIVKYSSIFGSMRRSHVNVDSPYILKFLLFLYIVFHEAETYVIS